LRHDSDVDSFALSADGRRLLLGYKGGRVQSWELGAPERDPADLARMARLLSLQEVEGSHSRRVSGRVLDEDWGTLRSRYPGDFRPNEGQVTAWHDRQAWSCVGAGQYAAALPHLHHLVAKNPDNHELQYHTATVCLGAGDRAAYRERCADMVRRFA